MIMNSLLKCLALLLMVCFVSCKATAQQFKSHTVKEGETLTSIARQYRVTPFNILKYNKQLGQGHELAPNTVLVIPVPAGGAETQPPPGLAMAKDSLENKQEVREEPIGFSSHRVRKRETLYGIAQRYQITEEDIKRYNRELYAVQLKKGMRIQIPKFRVKETPKDSINLEDFERYKVLPKETRWSIAHKYGITVDSLLKLNPDLPKTTNHLAIGQELFLPRIAGSSVDAQEVQLYESYTVPPKMTLYSLGKEYGIAGEQIVRLNPEIIELGGLKEGMVIRLPKKTEDTSEVNTDNFIFYEVKPRQTTYSLTRNLNITYRELLDLNPDLALGLKAGMVLKLPRERAVDLEVKNSLILDKINLLDSIHTEFRPKLLFLLPFRLDKIDFSDEENAKKAMESRNDIKYSLGLYTGAMVALDSVARLGISVDVKTFDTQLNLARTKQILLRENLAEYNAVIGPLQPNSVREVAVQAAQFKTPVVAPILATSETSLNNVFFSIPTDEVLREHMLRYMETQVTDQNIIIIADTLNIGSSTKIVEKFPQAKIIEVKEEEKNISIEIEAFTELLSEEQENWIFLESDNFKLVSSVTSILNSSNTEEIKVRMFTTNKNRAFENDVISGTHLSNLNFTFPSAYREPGNDSFVRQYQRRWGSTPDRYATRGFDLTYDLLLKLAYKMNLFEASELIGVTEYTGNKFNYSKDLASGYFNTASYIMMYDSMHVTEVKP